MTNETPYHLDRVLDNIFNVRVGNGWHTNVTEKADYAQTATEHAYFIKIPAVGVLKEDVNVNVVNKGLVVTVKPSITTRWSADFKQAWTLSEDADSDRVEAKLENGLLTIVVPRVKPATRTVNVTVQ